MGLGKNFQENKKRGGNKGFGKKKQVTHLCRVHPLIRQFNNSPADISPGSPHWQITYMTPYHTAPLQGLLCYRIPTFPVHRRKVKVTKVMGLHQPVRDKARLQRQVSHLQFPRSLYYTCKATAQTPSIPCSPCQTINSREMDSMLSTLKEGQWQVTHEVGQGWGKPQHPLEL